MPEDECNSNKQYPGRLRTGGVVEKCAFCIQHSRDGRPVRMRPSLPDGSTDLRQPVDAESEIRWVFANEKVFRLKEDLGTEPNFFTSWTN